MTIYSLYIFDRHCDCVYYQDWHRTRPIRPSTSSDHRAGVHRLPLAQNHEPSVRESIFSQTNSTSSGGGTIYGDGAASANGPTTAKGKGLPFDEEAKLVYGVVLSMRNMVKKLSGRDEAFTSYRTPAYKLHLFETPTGYRFVLLSDPTADSLRFVLRQLYVGAFMEFVVRNPLVQMDSRTEGIDNDAFRGAVDRHMRSLTMFGT